MRDKDTRLSYNFNKDKRTRSEINSSYKELISMVSSGKPVKIALYSNFLLEKRSK